MIALLGNLGSFVKYEFLQVLPPTIFFLCAFNIVAFTTDLILEQNQIQGSTHAVATVLALIIGKVVLVVNKLPLLHRFNGKPLFYPILFKSTIFTVFVTIVRLLEHWVPALIKTGGPVARRNSLLSISYGGILRLARFGSWSVSSSI